MRKQCFVGSIFSASLIFFLCGCATNYDQLPYMPEYPELQQTFKTDAFIEFFAEGTKEADEIFLRKLSENKYTNILTGTHYLNKVPDEVRILDFISFKHTTYNCQDGEFLDTRVLVMVRKNGVIWNEKLEYPSARYFQAFSQVMLSEDEEDIDSVYSSNLENAINNLFKIVEFRQALELNKKNVAVKYSDTADDLWTASKYYQSGENKNMFEAVRLAMLAADAGNDEAAHYIADNVFDRNVFGKNDRYLKFIEKMAAKGNAYAQNKMGLLCLNGDLVPENDFLAYSWFKKAAECGLPVAFYNVGFCYEHGYGVAKNLTDAKIWYRKAVAKGYKNAQKKLDSLEEE